MSDDSLGIGDLLLCGVDDAVAGVLGERDDEGLLRLDGEGTADGGEGQEEVCDQLHDCCAAVAWPGLVSVCVVG